MSGSSRNDINVTPLIDVLLVLLVIFLVATPLMMKLEPLDIPRTLDDPHAYSVDYHPTLSVRADLSVELDDGNGTVRMLAFGDIARTVRPQLDSNPAEKVVFVDFDDAVPWADVVMTLDSIRALATDANRDSIRVALKTEHRHAD